MKTFKEILEQSLNKIGSGMGPRDGSGPGCSSKNAIRTKLLRGVDKKQDDNGVYVCTHRARSKSYPSIRKIPVSVLKFIHSTG